MAAEASSHGPTYGLPYSQNISHVSATDGGRVFAGVHIHSETDQRLSVDHLPAAAQAPFDASSKQDDPLCLEDTRTDVLKQIKAWTYGQERSCIFWLNGMAGTGKSTIARTISREFSNRGHLGASFFFARGGGDVAHAGMFFTSIAKQLAIARPDVKPFISEAVQNQPDIASKSRNDQWTRLVTQPLGKVPADSRHPVLVVVVDALDECDNDNDMKGIVAALAQAQDVASVRLRIIVTSRPETPIRLGFKKMPEILHRDLLLHEQPREVVDADICLFFYSVFEEIRDSYDLSDEWPSVDTVNQLVHLSAGLFIFAATICRFIQEYEQSAEDSLNLFLSSNNSDVAAARDDFDEATGATTFILDSMYSQILERSRPHMRYSAAPSNPQRETLGAIAALSEALSVSAFASLLDLRESDIRQRLSRLHSVVRISTGPDSRLRLFHASFRDFLFDRQRCGNPDFFVDKQVAHRRLLQQCMGAMESALHRDLCNLQHPGALLSEVTQSMINAQIPLHVQYACRYWLDHSEQGQMSLDDDGPVDHFLRKYCLYWLEMMSILGKLPEAMTMMTRLESWVDAKKAPGLQSLVRDTLRFMRTFSHVLTKAPLQLYSAGIIFSPSKSIIRKSFGLEAPGDIMVISQIPDEWDACIQILEGHSRWVTSAVFSPNGSQVASSSWDKTVRVWDVQTGQCQHTLKGHSDNVESAIFSPDGSRVASGSSDRTVRVWAVQTGQCQHTLKGHLGSVTSVVFSPNGSQVASGSWDTTVRVWNVQTGQCQHTLKGHSMGVSSVVFSPDGSRMVSGSADKTIRVWNVQSGQCQHTLKDHLDRISSVVFSPDGSRIASGSQDQTVRVWDVQTGQCQHTLKCYSGSFKGYSGSVTSVVFSPDGSRLASGVADKTVRVWDVQTGQCESTLKGHSDEVHRVVFSPDGSQIASASWDKTVRVWDVQTGQSQHTFKGHSERVKSVVFSPNGSQVASGSQDNTVRVWDVQTSQREQTLEGHSDWVKSVVFSPDGSQVASGSHDLTVRVWDVQTGQCERTLKGHLVWISSVVFSPDGSQIASASWDSTVRVWNAQTGQCHHTLKGHSMGVTSVVFLSDGLRVASGSADRTVRVWDVQTGQCQHTLGPISHEVSSVVFSPDGSRVALGSGRDDTIHVWDVKTGQCQHTLEGHLGGVTSVVFSPDGSRVASGSYDRTVLVWDVQTGQCEQTLEGHSDWVTRVVFSPDGSRVASGSCDGTVLVWDVQTGQCEQTLDGHSRWITSVVFSPNGSRVASGSRSNTVRVWDVVSSTELICYDKGAYAYNIEFSDDSTKIVVDGESLSIPSQTQSASSAAGPFRPSPNLPAGKLSTTGDWVTLSSEGILWLPPEYRPMGWASYNDTIAIGSGSGRVTFVHCAASRFLSS